MEISHAHSTQIEKKFEEELYKELQNYPYIKVVRHYRVPTGKGGKRIILDFYISAPSRAIVEIKKSSKSKGMQQLLNRFEEVDTSFLEGVTYLNYDLSLDQDPENHEKILLPDNIKNIAKNISDQLFDENKISPTKDPLFEFADLGNFGEFCNSVYSIRTIMGDKKYNIFLKEFLEFGKEYRSKHYTSAALRIGRMLESAVYSIAQILNVKINYNSLDLLHKLDISVDNLKKGILKMEEPR